MIESIALLHAVDAAIAADPHAPYRWLFTAGCYAMAAGCLYHGIREGAQARPPHSPWKQAGGQVFLFAFLVFAFWLVESWAHHRTPFYLYSTAFGDLVPRFRFEGLVESGVTNRCTKLVLALVKELRADRIPLSVLLMEASLTYSALWTARLLGASLVIQPFLAALVLVNIDALLDPVVATAHNCTDGSLSTRPGIGLGFWRWYVDKESLAEWYGVPIFNYAAWFAAPVFLISLVNLLGRICWPFVLTRLRRSFDEEFAPRGWQAVALLTMAGMISFLHWIAPKHPAALGVGTQKAAMLGLLGCAALLVFGKPARWKTDEKLDVTLAWPASIALAVPALALLFEGFFLKTPQLIPVGIFAFAFAMLFAFYPYRGSIRSFCARVALLDRFARVHYFGFTAMLVLLGAALVQKHPDTKTVGGLLLVAICFHLWSYVLNDVIDLELDRTQPRRAKDPLVSGIVSREAALALAVVQLPLALLVTLHLLDFEPASNPWPLVVLSAGFALILVYNRWGKANRFPPLTDLVQGLGWASLVVYGALVASPHRQEFWPRVAPLCAYSVGFIMLISGVHGGLRDLWTDRGLHRKTTALLLGARPSYRKAHWQPVQSTNQLALYAFAIHTGMFATAGVFLWSEMGRGFFDGVGYLSACLLVAGLFLVNSVLLWVVVRPRAASRDRWMSWHALFLLAPPLALYLISHVPDSVFKILVACCFSVPLILQESILPNVISFLYRDHRRFVPNGCGPGHSRVIARIVPDGIGSVDWGSCCNHHDVAYWEGGIAGGLLPWRTNGRWEWRYLTSNFGLARCMWRRFGARARRQKSLALGFGLRIGQWLLPLGYFLATMLLGWITWSTPRRELSQQQAASLGQLTQEELARLARLI